MAPPTPQEWFERMPVITKGYFVGSVVVTLSMTFGLVNPMYLIWDATSFVQKFHIWRLITPFLVFGQLDFNWLIQMFLLTTYSQAVEQSAFIGSHPTADYAYCLMICAVSLLVSSFLVPMAVYGPSLLFAILHIWARLSPDAPVSFWGFGFKAWHIPFLLLAVRLITMGPSGTIPGIIGVVVGHLYHFLRDIVPKRFGTIWIDTPSWIIWLVEHWLPRAIGAITGAPSVVRPSAPNWRRSRGYRLE